MLKRALRRLRTWAPPISIGVIIGATAFLVIERFDAPEDDPPLPSARVERLVQHKPPVIEPSGVRREARSLWDEAPRPSRSYRNCAAARAAGDAPLHVGDAGYGDHLDRDGDGIACEPYRGR